jgi:hypothetical protein
MQKYIFIFYREYVKWQIVLGSDSPKADSEKLLKAYNEENDLLEGEKATECMFCTLEEWIRCLECRGSQYKKYIE